ncbi:sensor histidine kinase [Actinosynnema pretiosum]|uniref:histidine kinase n=2 Tax=Actinosynnema pretiosum TaxID=42197 RepID=A0A4Y6A613_9PSEU|nr:sensor histidine kinase [Actinosynnema pretiosum]ATE54246.1 histidine kinase [Actinosynnema pretiosum]QDE53708.1 sensor histidine kinase [Actinosynnema pretiosum subsp. pretiosum]
MPTATPAETDWDAWRRPPPTRAEQRRDVWAALLMIGLSLFFLVLFNSVGMGVYAGTPPSVPEQVLLTVALCLPMALRRRYPVAALAAVGVLFIAVQMRAVNSDNAIPSVLLFLAMHAVGAWERNRALAKWSRIAVIVVMFGWLGFALVEMVFQPPPEFTGAGGPLNPLLAAVLYNLVYNVVYFSGAYFFGNVSWVAARREAQLAEQAEHLRRSQEQATKGALVAERLRIARDLHDVVAHHVSVMGVQAGAARRVLGTDPELAGTALRTVEETARTAITELRGLLGVLRADGEPETGDRPASPGLEQLSELVKHAEESGLETQFGVYGTPRPVPEAVALSAYRVVQEALTNTVKHSSARRVDVRLRYLENVVEVEVGDDGVGGKPPVDGGGFGLRGMAERVAVHGGKLEVGPKRGGGFRVRALLPAGKVVE